MPRTLKLFFHDNCFDGACSAAIFSDFYRAHVDPEAEIVLQGVQHKRGDPFSDYDFDGDDNACVDFRYTDDPRLTWWFDHHASAFQPPSLRTHFEADTGGQKFYDPSARSCAKFEWETLRDRFDYRPDDPAGTWSDLVQWADVIDGAQFETPETAVELKEPALHIMTWLEHNRDHELTRRLIRLLGRRALSDLAAEPWIREPLAPILEEHARHIDVIRRRATCERGVVYFDLTEDGIAAHNKFIAYMLFPQGRYTVGVTRSPDRCKISVGSNPWSKQPREHDISAICERYGGGGHPVVGAVSLPPGELDRAREIAGEIRQELMSPA